MRTVLYDCVSVHTLPVICQRDQAEAEGFYVDEVVVDQNLPRASTPFAKRHQGGKLFDILQKDDILIVRWIDCLGRDYADIVLTIREFLSRGVTIRTIIKPFVFDSFSNDPLQITIRDSLIAFMTASAQAQTERSKAAQKAGIKHAKAQSNLAAYRGRKPSFDADKLAQVRRMLIQGMRVSAIAKSTGLARTTIHRIRDDGENMESALAKWDASVTDLSSQS